MKRLTLRGMIVVGLAGVLLLPLVCTAQSPYVATAPKPAQLASAKTAFLSNNSAAPLADSDKIYDEFYTGVQTLNRFQMVPTPNEADIILELSVHTTETNVQVVTLDVIDTKTHVILWSVSDSGQTKAIYGSHGKKNQHDVIDNLLDYLAAITKPA